MKRKLLFVVFLIVSFCLYARENTTNSRKKTVAATSVAYTTIPDSNFEAALEALGYDDISGDGQVPTNLIEGITSLDVTNTGISDLTGIADFTALESLIVNNNSIATIDVSTNQNLTVVAARSNGLTSLDITGCPNMSLLLLENNNLTSLDLTNNTLLTRVWAQNNNFNTFDVTNNPLLRAIGVTNSNLTALDVKNSTALEQLYISGNSITEIDLSNSPNMRIIAVENNALTTLNVKNGNNTNVTNFIATNNPNLSCITVDDATYSTNNWTSIDAQVNFVDTNCYVQIPDTNFEAALDALNLDDISSDGQVPRALVENVTALDVINQSITDLTGIEAFTALVSLRIGENPITNLDLSSNTFLEVLDASNCDIATLDITGLTQLSELRFALNELTSIDLSSFPNLVDIRLNSNNLTELNLRNGVNSGISVMDLRGNDNLTCVFIDDLNLLTTATVYYSSQTNFTTTNYCDYTAIPDTNFEDALSTYDDISNDGQVPTALISTVSILDVSSNSISDLTGIEDFAALTELIVSNNSLTSLDISSNSLLERIEIESMSTFTGSFDVSNNLALQEILMIGTNCTGITFGNNTNLEILDASNNEFTSLDLSGLTGLLGINLRNNSLQELNLKNGTNTNIVSFSATNNMFLSCILVDDATYSTANWTSINATTIFSNTYCAYTTIPDSNFEAALEALGYDDIADDGQVPTALIENLTTLDVSDQMISDISGIEAFTNLQTLTISDNTITTIDLSNLTQLVNLYANNNQLSAIDLSTNTLLEIVQANDNSFTSFNTDTLSQLTELSVSNNSINSLDFTQNVFLEIVRASNNSLTNFVPTMLTDIQVLDLSGNSISQLNLSNNTDLEDLNTQNNQLETIDVTANTALTSIQLDTNSLTDADFKNGNNTNIVTFSITGNSGLECVFVDNAAYSTTNWTNIDAQMIFRDGDYCEYTAIPDSNFEAALGNEGLDDVSGDNQVPTALLANESILVINGENIADLTGIEDFPRLRILRAKENNITTLDVSANTLLVSIDLEDNNITSIDLNGLTSLESLQLENNNLSTIDLSTNTALETLTLNNNTNLASLDLSTNTGLRSVLVSGCSSLQTITFGSSSFLGTIAADHTALTSLNVNSLVRLRNLSLSNTSLTSLDVSSNTVLREFNIQNTPIASLNVQNGNNTDINNFIVLNNANLFCILVDDITYSTNNWTNIDPQITFSTTYCAYTTIPDSNFEAVLDSLGYDDILGDGQVPTLLIEDVTSLSVQNQSIADLTGIEDFTALQTLNASNNVLTAIDLTENTLLEFLNVRNNQLTTIDLTNNTNLEDLEIDANNLESLDVATNTLLTQIAADNNSITSLNLTTNTVLLNLSITDNGLETLTVGTNTTLTDFEVQNNALVTLNLDGATALDLINLSNNDLETLSVRNGTNTGISVFNTTGNSNLRCISVDDAAYSTTNWINIDATTRFSEMDYCAYTAIPDSDFETYLENLGYDDISNDGQVPTALIEGVILLDLSTNASLSIADLTGIEDFAALEELNVGGNSIVTLDVTSNTNLIKLDCSGNGVYSIDITGLTALEELDASSSSYTVLDVSTNINLKKLKCNFSELTALDVSNLPLLTELDCRSTFITTLNVRNGNNTNFTNFNAISIPVSTCILVDDAVYSTANWTNIEATASFTSTDYCRYTSIVDPNFEASLGNLGYDDIANDGQVPTALIEVLTSLDVSLLNISDITGIKDFAALQSLNLSNTNVVSVDVSGMDTLEMLNVTATAALTSLDVSNNEALKTIIASNSNVSAIDFTNATALEVLSVSNTNLPSLNTSELVALKELQANNNALLIGFLDLTENVNLEIININNTGLSSLDLRNGNNTTITAFSATSNASLPCILVDDASYSTTNWTNIDPSTTFSSTYCVYTAIPDTNFEAALDALGYDDILGDGQVPTPLIESVTSLNVGNKSIADLTGIEDFAGLTYLNVNNNQIVTLDLSGNTLLEEFFGLQGILESVNTSNCTNLRIFSADQNALTTLDFSNNIALEELMINRNNLMSLTVANNINLTRLQVADNPIGTIDVSTNILLEILSVSNCGLTTINLNNNQVLERLFLSNNNITAIDLSNNLALEYFVMEQNQLTTIDFSNNPLLEEIDIRNNDILSLHVTDLEYLEEINIEENFNLSSLTFGNLPVFTDLTANDCALTSIELTNLSALVRLDLARNQLTALDLSQNAVLNRVYANSNNLSFLSLQNGNNTNIIGDRFNAYNNPNLTCIFVDDVAYSTTNWTNIDATTIYRETDYCDYTTIPDSDFETYLENLGYDDVSNDGQVPTVLIEGITSLNFDTNETLHIVDLTGIEDFTALEDLNINGNGIATLDVTSNTNLIKLDCRANGITSIDITGLTALEELIAGFNSYAELDVSTNINLKKLQCNETSLTALDVSNLPLLTELDCRSTFITTLNVRNGNNTNFTNFNAISNPSLTCIFVDDAVYSTANWTNIEATASFTSTDYCRYTSIPDPNFEAALGDLGYDDIINDGQVPTALIEVIATLNVSGENITDLTGILDFTALQVLDITGNNIVNLDISGMPNLLSLDAEAAITNSLNASNTPLLESISVYESTIAILDVSGTTSLEELLVYRTNISELDLSTNNSLTRLIAFEIPALRTVDLTGAVLLRDLELYRNSVETLDLSSNISLEFVSLFESDLRSLNIQNGNNTNISLFDASSNANLTCIRVDDVTYSTTNWTQIDATTNFSDAYCRYTQIPDSNFEAYLESIGYDDILGDGQVPTALIENVVGLFISNAPIADITGIEGFSSLKDLFFTDTNLTNVDVSQNPTLIRLGFNNSGISSLNISENTNLEFLSIANSSIASLDLSNNLQLNFLSLTDVGITELDLSVNTALEKFFLINAPNIASLNLQNGTNTSILQFSIGSTPNLTCVLVDDVSYSTTNWPAVSDTISFSEASCANVFDLDIKVFLQGAALNPNSGEENLMRDDLRVAGLLPTTSPYSDGLTCETTVFDTTGADAIVDWVFVELRDAFTNTTVVNSQSALLQRDGDVVGVDGISPLAFTEFAFRYYVVIKHRNHLGIMSSNSMSLTNSGTIIDFTDANNQITYGSNAQTSSGMPNGIVAMWSGNVNTDSRVQYSGTTPDTPVILSEVLNDSGNFLNFPTYSITAYNVNDANMDGIIQYSGTNPDTPFILQNILAHPGNFLNFSTYAISEQLPENSSAQ